MPQDDGKRLLAQRRGPSDDFAVTAGEPVLGGLRGVDLNHFFCPQCMSWLFTRVRGMNQFVNIRSTLLDDPSGTEPFVETWTSERLPWAVTPARHGFAGFPPIDAYASLTADYAASA